MSSNLDSAERMDMATGTIRASADKKILASDVSEAALLPLCFILTWLGLHKRSKAERQKGQLPVAMLTMM